MLYREIIAVCSQIHTKHVNTLCGLNVEFFNGKPGGTYDNHWALNLKGYINRKISQTNAAVVGSRPSADSS